LIGITSEAVGGGYAASTLQQGILMLLPFTPDQFQEVFAAYNCAVWPARLVALGVIEAHLQVGHDLVDRLPTAFLLPPLDLRFATGNELGLHTTPSRGRDDRLLDELGQRLAFTQDGLDFRTDLGLDANGIGGRAHC
jgi:hypothetical protein